MITKIKKEIDTCVIEKGQQTEKIINRKNTKNKEKIKIDQDQEIKNMIRRARIKIMIVEGTDNKKNNHVRKKIKKDHILQNHLQKTQGDRSRK